MFSKKEVFENYLGKLGLSKTAFEAVKGINGVLFEGIDDELEEEFDDDGSATDTENVPPVGIAPVPEIIAGKEENPSVEAGGPEEAVEPDNGPSSSEFDELKPVHFNNAYQEACKWARQEPNFNKFWNVYRAIDEISFMIPSETEGNVYYNKNTVPYVITVEGEDDVPKYEYETATNPVKMSTQVHDLIMHYYEEHGNEGMVDLSEIPFIDIERLVLGTGLHNTGEEAPNIGVPCTVEIDPSATVLSTNADTRNLETGVCSPNIKVREALSKKYGLPVEYVYKALFKEWTEANPKYVLDEKTCKVYDTTKETMTQRELRQYSTQMRPKKKGKLNGMRLIDWAKTQDMFHLLLRPNAYGIRNLVETSAIYKVPNNNIEGISPKTPYVYMDDKNYDSYIKSNPNISQNDVEQLAVSKLNEIVSDEYNAAMGNADKSGANAYGYDENGWVENIECELVQGRYVLNREKNIYKKIRDAYGKNANVINYIAGKNFIDVGGSPFHPLVHLARVGRFISPRVVAVFDETCCNPTESIKKIVGVNGFDGPKPTIYGYAIISNGCDLGKTGDFEIKSCGLSNVNIKDSTGFVKIGANTGDPSKTMVSDTIIAVGNNGANQVLPNNQIVAETVDGIRGVQIVNSELTQATIKNGYAKILNCNLNDLTMTNAGSKDLAGWNTDDASNVEFVGDKLIKITGSAVYKVGWEKSNIPGKGGYAKWEAGDIKTAFTGRVVLDASAGNVTCSGTKLNNTIVNGPCKLRTCDLDGTTIGSNADDQASFKMTDMTAVKSSGAVQIEHGVQRGTILGDSDKDRTCGKITLSGRVRIDGDARVFSSHIHSVDDTQCTRVRSNMHLDGCSEYTLNEQDSATLSMHMGEGSTIMGVCTTLQEAERRLQLDSNSFGGAADNGTPTERYDLFKSGDTSDSLCRLNLYESNILINDFLQNTSSILMDPSVFRTITDDGDIVPEPNLKRTIWDPIGGFFVGEVNSETLGSMIVLKCPNVVLDHKKILQKKHEFGQDIDYKAYASGAITLRQYVNFLEKNGYDDCFQYVGGKFGKEFVQLCLINPKTNNPYKITLDQMNTLCGNNKSKRFIQEFLNIDTTANHISEIDTYDNITSAYTDNLGTLTVQIDGGRREYIYKPPHVNDAAKAIQSECTKAWYEGDKKKHKTYTVDCSRDALYRYAYDYMRNHGGSKSNVLSKIHAALSGNTTGLKKLDYAAHIMSRFNGTTMQSNEIDMSQADALNEIKHTLGLKPGEDLYFLQPPAYEGSTKCSLVIGWFPKLKEDRKKWYDARGCEALRFRMIESYNPAYDEFTLGTTETIPVKRLDKSRPSLITTGYRYLMYRPAYISDFVKLLHYPITNEAK